MNNPDKYIARIPCNRFNLTDLCAGVEEVDVTFIVNKNGITIHDEQRSFILNKEVVRAILQLIEIGDETATM